MNTAAKMKLVERECEDQAVRLNLGAGDKPLEGWENIDRKSGREVSPLNVPDDSVDVIRASHVLEHFSHRQITSVVQDWVRALKPGGTLKIAVPDFEKIARGYLSGERFDIQGYTMGGHVDANDFHKCIFDEAVLTELLRGCGLRSVRPWVSEIADCAALPISLNLQGTKPIATQEDVLARAAKTHAVMSVPRLGFMDNFFSILRGFVPLKIEVTKVTGAYWGQCIERGMEEAIQKGAEWILTCDYDSLFSYEDVRELIALSIEYPHADAIAPIQVHRTRAQPLMTIVNPDGNGENATQLPWNFFEPELSRINTAHFGLTLLKVAALDDVGHPWFHDKPSPGGTWNNNRVDADIHFWQEWAANDKTLYLANHLAIGHMEMMARWPNRRMEAQYSNAVDFWHDGKPDWVWR